MEDRISVDPKVCSGKPCIRGTRIMVKNILGMLAGGVHDRESARSLPGSNSRRRGGSSQLCSPSNRRGEGCPACLSRSRSFSIRTYPKLSPHVASRIAAFVGRAPRDRGRSGREE